MDLTPKQQTSEAIRQAETVLIITGQHPSIDQATAVMALAMILRKFGKKVSAVVSDPLPSTLQFLGNGTVEPNLSGLRDFVLQLDVTKAEVDKLRYEVEDGKLKIVITPFKGGFAPSDVTFDYGDMHFDLAIVLGVPNRSRIDTIFANNQTMFSTIPLLNLDFHRSNENYGAVNLIEPNASSLCEMLVALAESLQGGIIDADIATILLTGIVGSTDRFTASHTTPKSLTVAAQMMAAGARQQAVVRALYRDGKGGNEPSRSDTNGRSGGNQPRNNGGNGNGGGNNRNQNQNQNNDRDRTSDRTSAPAASGPNPEPVEPRIVAVAPSPAPMTVSAPVSVPAPEPQNLPIIEPAHIELSGPAPVTPVAPLAPPMPMADFDAAAQIFKTQPASDEARPANPVV